MDNILCWNVRGLNRVGKQNKVKKFLLYHQIKLFSCFETRVKGIKMGPLYLNLCPGWCFTTNISQHKNGRIIVGWDPDAFEVNIISMSPQLVHCHVTANQVAKSFIALSFMATQIRKGGNLFGWIFALLQP